jgi:hypothetical protein
MKKTDSPLPIPKGMVEMFTTISKKEADVVKEILREHHIKYRSREEQRSHSWRYCIYVPSEMSKKAYAAIDQGLLDRDMWVIMKYGLSNFKVVGTPKTIEYNRMSFDLFGKYKTADEANDQTHGLIKSGGYHAVAVGSLAKESDKIPKLYLVYYRKRVR